jgi:hypothetical protein
MKAWQMYGILTMVILAPKMSDETAVILGVACFIAMAAAAFFFTKYETKGV